MLFLLSNINILKDFIYFYKHKSFKNFIYPINMKYIAKTNASNCRKLGINYLFFIKLHKTKLDDSNVYFVNWQSADSNIEYETDDLGINTKDAKHFLCIVDRINEVNQTESESSFSVDVTFHIASPYSTSDWKAIINHATNRFLNNSTNDHYYLLELLWFLDIYDWKIEFLKESINSLPDNVRSSFFNIINHVGKCLSYNKQKLFELLFAQYGKQYLVYTPGLIYQAYDTIHPNGHFGNEKNLFILVDEIMNEKDTIQMNKESSSTNYFLKIKNWLQSQESLEDYSLLNVAFPMFNNEMRLDVVKRYFHEIQLGHTIVDLNILRQFISNKYDDYIRFRHSIENPTEPVNLAVPLLCDNIITLIESKGEKIIDFNSILNIAITQSNTTNPNVDFCLHKIFPLCNGGASYNRYFHGFIKYCLICEPDENKVSDNKLKDLLFNLLDLLGSRTHSPEISWSIPRKYLININSFLKNEIKNDNDEYIVIISQILSIQKFRNFIQSTLNSYRKDQNNDIIVDSDEESTINGYLILNCTNQVKMRIYPRNNVILGEEFDLLNLNPLITKDKFNNHDEFIRMHNSIESIEIKRRTIDSLKKYLNLELINQQYIELPYDKTKLMKIKHLYYYNVIPNNNKNSYDNFLINRRSSNKYKLFCAPELSRKNNIALDLPFFWCRGNECFKNCLSFQTTEVQKDWHLYTIFHISEIVGYKLLHSTQIGYEPVSIMRSYVGMIQKILTKFESMKCRECGQLLYTHKDSDINRYLYFSCKNKSCTNYNMQVYLNFCYNCSKEIIDSRDNKKCPNGLYICPSCLSCCNDKLFDREVQKQRLSGRRVSNKSLSLLGHGHNDKGIFYCPSCGSQLETIINENNKEIRKCLSCGKLYHDEIVDDKNPFRLIDNL